MSLFRKSQPIASESPEPEAVPIETSSPSPPPTAGKPPSLFNGSSVDVDAIYRTAKLGTDELDRVARAEELLHALPSTAAQTREVVDATLRAFGVDRTKILEAASRQGTALEAFIRFSHEQTQRVLDAGAQRISELEAEIERCRQIMSQATREGDDRARTVNDILLKVQRVLEFFGDSSKGASDVDMDADTMVSKPADAVKAMSRSTPNPVSRQS